jgi:hypothetical protein
MAPKLTQEIKDKLPENYSSDDWEPIDPEDIQVGDYIAYIAKPRKYQKYKADEENPGGWKKGGIINAIPNMDEQMRRKANNDKVFFFRAYTVQWSVNQDNVVMFFKSKKNVEEILASGKKRARETKEQTRVNKLKFDTEKLEEQLEEVSKEEKKPARRGRPPKK